MRNRIISLACIVAVLGLCRSMTFAQNVGATSSGDWSTASIWTTGSVPGSSNTVFIGSTYPAGSAGTVTVTVSSAQSAGDLYLGYNNSGGQVGTLNLAGGALTIANDLVIGASAGSIGTISESGGWFTAANAYVENGNTLGLGISDVVSNLKLQSGATVTTASTGNVTSNVNLNGGSVLNLGANLSVTGYVDVEDTGTVLHMNGNNISAGSIYLGWGDHEAVTLDRGTTPGLLATSNLYIGDSTLDLLSSDATTNLHLYNGTLTTASTSNITSNVNLNAGSVLNLGANLSVTGYVDVEDTGSILNGHGFGITSNSIYAGFGDGQAVSLTNLGTVDTNNLYVGGGSTVTLHGGDIVNRLISLTGGSTLTVQQTNGSGLTLNGNSLGSLSIDPSQMDLIFNLNTEPNWDFRWADPSAGGNWVSEIESLIDAGDIVVTAPQGYSVIDQNGYTYIEGNFAAVPEPSALVLACIACASVAIGLQWNRRYAAR